MEYERVLHGRFADTEGVYEAYVGVSKGKIAKISDNELKGRDFISILQPHYIFPAFIDTHVHLREPGWEQKEDFATGSAAALNGGVKTVLDMPNLPEPIDTLERLEKKIALAQGMLVDIRHFAMATNAGEIKKMARLAVGYKIYTAKSTGDSIMSWDAIEKASSIIASVDKPATFHCEDKSLFTGATRHSDARPRESEILAIEKALGVVEKTGVEANIAHVSTEEGARFCREAEVMHEVTPHHAFFTKEQESPLLKMNPPLREKRDCDALLRALREGNCMLATDHAPHTLKEKQGINPPSGVPGLDTYGLFVSWLLKEKWVSPRAIAKVTSHNAARFFSLPGGRIAEGAPAAFTVIGTEGSTIVHNSDVKTKCGWTPFDGITMPGKVIRVG